ncbi:MAG: hypothetical protein P8Y48_05100 [Novosphingobium sp.]
MLAIASALPLGGCKKDKDSRQTGTAKGEILPRSVSDDMLPYDTVRSQAPLANPDAGKHGNADSPASGSTEAATADAPAETAPETGPATPDAG